MDRSQQHLCLLLIPLECFVPVSEDDVEMHSFDHSKYPPVQCIYEETSSIWINVRNVVTMQNECIKNAIISAKYAKIQDRSMFMLKNVVKCLESLHRHPRPN